MALSLKKNFSFALIGNLGYAASQYIILLIFIKLYSVDDVGVFVYAGAFTTPIMMALEMQLRNFYITDQNNDFSLGDYFTFRVLTNIIGVICLFFSALYLRPDYFAIILVVTLIKVFESQLDLIYGVYQKNNRLDYVAYSRILRGVIAVLIVSTISLLFKNILYSLIAYFFTWVLLYFLYERRQVVSRGFINENEMRLVLTKWSKMKPLLVLCVPMFFSIFIDKYYLNYPRISVEKILGLKMLGIFGSLIYFKSLGGQFIASLAQSAIPKLSIYVGEKKISSFSKLLFKMILVGALIGLVLSLLSYLGGKPLLKLLYTEEYANYANVLSIILLGATVTFSYIFLATALTCIRKQWIKLPISIISFILIFFMINFSKINSLMDISLIVLYVELFTFFIYYVVYMFFIKKEVKSWNKIKKTI